MRPNQFPYSMVKVEEKELEKQNLDETINALAMASPFTLEEKQVLLETINLNERKKKLAGALNRFIRNN